mmetsp:Transcript_14202/g.23327  ORF Transcript_14202/g.23327 Transcript_14202/m.23327 type:complete len:116 (+) Transcript_14202:1077-1424(+)
MQLFGLLDKLYRNVRSDCAAGSYGWKFESHSETLLQSFLHCAHHRRTSFHDFFSSSLPPGNYVSLPKPSVLCKPDNSGVRGILAIPSEIQGLTNRFSIKDTLSFSSKAKLQCFEH